MTEQEAIAIAQECVRRENIAVGKVCRIRFVSVGVLAQAGIDASEARWMVSFEYQGPAVEEAPKVIVHPPTEAPTTVIVGDESKAAEILTEL